jgi:hypothetical protein
VRGFAPWSPEKATLALLDQVQGILDEYADHLPLSVRSSIVSLAPTTTRRRNALISVWQSISTALAARASSR